MERVRVRQHVNPLSQVYQIPIALPNWQQIYTDLSKPIYLDIGAARGKFLLQMAQLHPQYNFLGIEIREPLVIKANQDREKLGLTNLYFLFANINNFLEDILKSLPEKALHGVTIQFPDPWFKRRHSKRRVVQPELVETLARYLVNGGTVFLQSDVKFVAQEMCDRFSSYQAFQKQHQNPWLSVNPLPVSTEREKSTLDAQKNVYRALFSRVESKLLSLD